MAFERQFKDCSVMLCVVFPRSSKYIAYLYECGESEKKKKRMCISY